MLEDLGTNCATAWSIPATVDPDCCALQHHRLLGQQGSRLLRRLRVGLRQGGAAGSDSAVSGISRTPVPLRTGTPPNAERAAKHRWHAAARRSPPRGNIAIGRPDARRASVGRGSSAAGPFVRRSALRLQPVRAGERGGSAGRPAAWRGSQPGRAGCGRSEPRRVSVGAPNRAGKLPRSSDGQQSLRYVDVSIVRHLRSCRKGSFRRLARMSYGGAAKLRGHSRWPCVLRALDGRPRSLGAPLHRVIFAVPSAPLGVQTERTLLTVARLTPRSSTMALYFRADGRPGLRAQRSIGRRRVS